MAKKQSNATLRALRKGLQSAFAACKQAVSDVRVAHAEAILRNNKRK
ncbi:hypothetical protein [Paratractidigestivibacter sp.]|nr:hypothetical protein [Paratractidigestivibacter sp.]